MQSGLSRRKGLHAVAAGHLLQDQCGESRFVGDEARRQPGNSGRIGGIGDVVRNCAVGIGRSCGGVINIRRHTVIPVVYEDIIARLSVVRHGRSITSDAIIPGHTVGVNVHVIRDRVVKSYVKE